jgi:hypothetical protein
MAPEKHKSGLSPETSLIFVEGDTEIEFYRRVFDKYLPGYPKRVFNLEGNINIYNKVLDKTCVFIDAHRQHKVRVYCLIDREHKEHKPPLDVPVLINKFRLEPLARPRILDVGAVVATQMIESWFFHDIEAIFEFLKVPVAKRHPENFRIVQNLTHVDLSNLFHQNGKAYYKGKRCANFVNRLDIDKIFRACKELRDGINLLARKRTRPLLMR